jgi:hypothetical protein
MLTRSGPARQMGVLAHDARAIVTGDGDAEDGLGADEHDLAQQTVNFAALRGLRLERWMPGAGPDEWDEAGLVGNEEQATTIMRREAETKKRSVMDIFGRGALPEGKESDEEPDDAGETPAPGEPDTRRLSLEAAALLRRTSSAAGTSESFRRATLLDEASRTSPSPQPTPPPSRGASLDLPRPSTSLQRTMSTPTSLAAAMAAMASHMGAHGGSPPEHAATHPGEHESEYSADPTSPRMTSPGRGAGDDVLAEAADADRVVERARGRASVYRLQQAEEEDAHGLLGIVRRHRPRGLQPAMSAPPAVLAAAAAAAAEVDAAHVPQALQPEVELAEASSAPPERGVRWADE